MSTIHRDAEDQVIHNSHYRSHTSWKCTFCGTGKPTACWDLPRKSKPESIYICKECAIHALPHLLAEAIIGTFPSDWHSTSVYYIGDRMYEETHLTFWKAFAAALSDRPPHEPSPEAAREHFAKAEPDAS